MFGDRVLLQMIAVRKLFPLRRSLGDILRWKSRNIHAVDGVSLDIFQGETVSMVGETGSGKSTLARLALRLLEPTSGCVIFDGIDLATLTSRELRELRLRFQIVMQDPLASLNPRQSVASILELPLRAHKVPGNHTNIIRDTLELVGLDSKEHMHRYPHEFSGGQQQRISIARALILQPDLLVADEPVSSLDLSVRAQILNLLTELREKLGLTYFVVAHDLGMVRYLSDRVVVLYLGQIAESGKTEQVFDRHAHPYTGALLAAMPRFRSRQVGAGNPIRGELPSPINLPDGCRFSSRCPIAHEICLEEIPQIRVLEQDHYVACHFADEVASNSS